MGTGERCVDANSSSVKQIVCPSASVSGPWSYNADTQQLIHRRGTRCLTVRGESVSLAKCDDTQDGQKWIFKDTKPYWAT